MATPRKKTKVKKPKAKSKTKSKKKKKPGKPFTKNDSRASDAGKKSKRGPSLTTSLQNVLDAKAPIKKLNQIRKEIGLAPVKSTKLTVADMVALNITRLAISGGRYLQGDVTALKEIYDRIDGRTSIAIDEDEDEISMIFKIKKKAK